MWKQLKVSIYCVVRSTCCNVNLCRRKRREWKKNDEISRTTNIFRIFSFERWDWRSLPRSRARRLSIPFYPFLFLGNFSCFFLWRRVDIVILIHSYFIIFIIIFVLHLADSRSTVSYADKTHTLHSVPLLVPETRMAERWVFREGSVFVRKTPYAPLPCMRIRGFVSLRSNAMAAAFADSRCFNVIKHLSLHSSDINANILRTCGMLYGTPPLQPVPVFTQWYAKIVRLWTIPAGMRTDSPTPSTNPSHNSGH